MFETRIVDRRSYLVDPKLHRSLFAWIFKVLVVRCPRTLHLYLLGIPW